MDPRLPERRRPAVRRGARHPRHRAQVRRSASSRRTSADWYDAGHAARRARPASSARSGLLGMHLEGLRLRRHRARSAYGVACRELEAVDSGLRSFVSVQGSLAMFAIHHWGSEAAARRRGCRGWRRARRSAASASPSPTPAATRARCGPGRGATATTGCSTAAKMWITNGTLADVAVVWAQTDDGIRGFVVPTDTRGFTAHEDPRASCRCARR